MDDEKIQQLFQFYNQHYFNGRLARYKVVFSDRFAGGRCDGKTLTIFLYPQSPTPIRRLLLHEMAHVTGGAGHGKKFQDEIRRLISFGAPLKIELKQLSKRHIGSAAIVGDFEDAGQEGIAWRIASQKIGYENQLVDNHGVAANKPSARLLRKGYYAWRRGAAFRAEMLRSMPSLKRAMRPRPPLAQVQTDDAEGPAPIMLESRIRNQLFG
jgi:hypothetical protein